MTVAEFYDVGARLGCALLAGILIGVERESHGRAAGLRTTILACIASALAMILSEYLFARTAGPGWRPDPGRLGAGILTGIGFLGGGTILRSENTIRGVTTAATLWFVTVLGLVFGGGLFYLGFAGLVIALLTLFALTRFEKYIPTDFYGKFHVTMESSAFTEPELRQQIESVGTEVKSMEIEYDLVKSQKTIVANVKFQRQKMFETSEALIATISRKPGVLFVKWV